MAKNYRGTKADLQFLARRLRAGDLVAVPSETVYGLAADALSAKACRKIFNAKGRPSSDPLIVHVGSIAQAASIAEIGPAARKLMRQFWPGPLTLVLPKKPVIPDIVTSGRPSVAVRMPAHPLFLKLLAETGTPLAAPSANPFGYVSPTTARHVQDGLGKRIKYILDGGPCEVGVESTIVDLRDPQRPRLLRPGQVTKADLERVLRKQVVRGPATALEPNASAHIGLLQPASGRAAAGRIKSGHEALEALRYAILRVDVAAKTKSSANSGAATTSPAAVGTTKIPLNFSNPPAPEGQTHPLVGMIAPGMLARHYSPHTPVVAHRKITWAQVQKASPNTAWVFVKRPKRAKNAKNVFAWDEPVGEDKSEHPKLSRSRNLTRGQTQPAVTVRPVRAISAARSVRNPSRDHGRSHSSTIAHNLFALLRKLDSQSWQSIQVEYAPRGGLGDAINDRLTRAAAQAASM